MAAIYSNYSGLVNTAILPIYPTVANLPSTAIDGATAITLDTHDLYIFNAGTGWVAGGGSGAVTTSNIFSTNTPIATAGFMRLGNADAIEWRNSTNTANQSLSMEGGGGERFIFNNAIVSQTSSTALVRSLFSNTGTGASSQVKLSISMFDDIDIYANSVAGGASAGIAIGGLFTGGFTIQIAGANPLSFNTNGAVGLAINSAQNVNVGGQAINLNLNAAAAAQNTITPASTNDGSIAISGDSSVVTGGNIQMYGHSHASLASCFQVLSGAAVSLKCDANNNVIIGSGALATSATNGFLYADSCAGTPTGVPTTVTGRVPMVVDTSTGTGKLWFYVGGAWKGVLLT